MTALVAALLCLGACLPFAAVNRRWPKYPLVMFHLVVALLFGALTGWLGRRAAYGDTEYWTGYAAEVCKKDQWTEVKTSTDSKGKTHTEVIHHPDEYWLTDTNDVRVDVDNKTYLRLARQFGHKPSTFGLFGAEHRYPWGREPAAAEVVTTRHYFENRPAHSDSVFAFFPPSAEEAKAEGLFEWDTFEKPYRSRFAYGLADSALEAELALLNADLGKTKQVRVHLLVWTDKPVDTFFRQRAYWRGGKKNELNVCVGLHPTTGRADWCQVISWSKSEPLKAAIADHVTSADRFDPHALVRYLRDEIPAGWERRQFSEFDYIHTRTPLWAYLLAAVLGAACGVVVSLIPKE